MDLEMTCGYPVHVMTCSMSLGPCTRMLADLKRIRDLDAATTAKHVRGPKRVFGGDPDGFSSRPRACGGGGEDLCCSGTLCGNIPELIPSQEFQLSLASMRWTVLEPSTCGSALERVCVCRTFPSGVLAYQRKRSRYQLRTEQGVVSSSDDRVESRSQDKGMDTPASYQTNTICIHMRPVVLSKARTAISRGAAPLPEGICELSGQTISGISLVARRISHRLRDIRSHGFDQSFCGVSELWLNTQKQKVNLKKLISSTKREKVEGGQSELKELPSGSKLDVEGSESPEDESEEGEDDEGEDDDDSEEEEEEEEEEGEEDEDDDDDDIDENEDDEEGDEHEETAVASETTGLSGLPKIVALCTTEQSEMANKNANQPGQDMMEDSVSEDSPLKVRTDQEQEASEKMETKETIPEKMVFGGPLPGILDLEDGCLVSAVRVEARFSDEEDSEEADDSPAPSAECEASLPSVDRTSNRNPVESKNENQSDDEDEELLKTEKNVLEVETSQGRATECDPQLQVETDDVPLKQNEGITDLGTSSLYVPSASPKPKAITTADDDEDDWDDVEEEEEVQTKKPLNLFLTLLGQKEPESPEVSLDHTKDKIDGTPKRYKE
ncbi:protein bfr2-like [Cyprinus carpio]|uniref:Protein bfr2-like n=1 Tax=Cyprinus carpio TaxID=7962 RepID=A0A9Q9XVF9_CYPCA|nr:protein bfr2-like [Cyprinus carpio]